MDGRRRLLAPIAYADAVQFYYCLDLSEAQPTNEVGIAIWSIDHDGTGPGRVETVAEFLKNLSPAKRR